MVSVNIDTSKIVTYNKLQLGTIPDFAVNSFLSIPAYGNYLKEANMKFIRVCDSRDRNRGVSPCTAWNESSKTGTFDWSLADAFVAKCSAIGAQPLFTLGYARDTEAKWLAALPPGMTLNPTTGLPYSDSFAAYARQWVKHFKQKGQPVIYYELMNEPYAYFGWNPDLTKLGYYLQLFSATAAAMRTEDPNISISFDYAMRTPVLDYWLANNGAELDSLNFHKYPTGIVDPADPAYLNDPQLFLEAERVPFVHSTAYGYSTAEAQQKCQIRRGRLLPVICSENNLNWQYTPAGDPRIIRMAGAVYQMIFLRKAVLTNLSYSVYYNMADHSKFGLFNLTNTKPWAAYYTYLMLGRNLLVGNPIVESTPDSADIRSLAWVNGNTLFLLLANLTHNSPVVQTNLSGSFETTRIDETMPNDNVSPVNAVFAANAIPLNGYTVMLLKANLGIKYL